MLKFFRRIRQSLIKEGKLKKYLFYAIGEILLVMLGILLALQVNNWNSGLKADQDQQKYLLALHEEFQNNLREINRNIKLCDSILVACKQIINHKQLLDTDIELRLAKANEKAFRFPPKFIKSPGILNELVNSGYLSKLNNQALRTQIQNWFSIIEKVEEEEIELWTHRNNTLQYMQEHSSFRKLLRDLEDPILGEIDEGTFKLNYTEMYNDNYYDNLNILYAIVITALKDFVYPELKDNIESILQEIERDLNE